MNHQSKNAERYMLSRGLTVRYQPCTGMPTYEALARLEHLANNLYGLAHNAGITMVTHASFHFSSKEARIRPDQALLYLAELQYNIHVLAHALGLAQLLDPAFDELHASNMSKVWPDGRVHRSSDGSTKLPDTYRPPNMEAVIRRYGTQPMLFDDPKPSEVIEDENHPGSL